MRDLKIQYCSPSSLHIQPRNPRTHTTKQIEQVAESIRTFGFTNPVLVDSEFKVLAGHCRIEAAKRLNLDRVPVVCIQDMTQAQKRAYVIADNKLAELAGWDVDLLGAELQFVAELDMDFDLTVLGFATAEVDQLLGGGHTEASEEPPLPEPDLASPATTQVGDLWILGRNRLLCGDALNQDSYATLMDGQRAEVMFADPPYNVRIDGHVCGLGGVKHEEFAMASGEMSEAEYVEFLGKFMKHAASNCKEGSIHFVCIDWRHIYEVIAAGRNAYAELKNVCVWAKTNGGMGSFYRSQHELVCVFKHGTVPHINNVELGRFGRYRTNVWTYPGMNGFGPERDEELRLHPTVKPVALVADAILDCSHRNGVVLDPFGGSGTTILAAEQTGRRACAIELSPHYVDVAIRRWQQMTGQSAVHAESQKTFDEIAIQTSEVQ